MFHSKRQAMLATALFGAAIVLAGPGAARAGGGKAAVATAAAPAGQAATPSSDQLEQLAQRLVTQSAAVREGDLVLITGDLRDAELMEDIAVQVRREGAFPMIQYSSDRLAKRLFFDVPARYDSQTNGWGKTLTDAVDVVISLGNGGSEDLFEGADPARLAARAKAGEAIAKAFIQRNIRRVEVGNNLYPTPWRAERYGMDEAALAKLFWNGVNLDYTQLQERGAQVRDALLAGDVLHVTNPNGTDLTLRIGGRKVMVSDGIISAEDIRQGGAATSVYLPAGEVYTTPVPGSVNGTLVDTGAYFRGQPVDEVRMTVADGKVTAMSGSGPGYAGLKAAYDAVDDARKDQFAFVDFGINPNITLPAGSRVGNWVPAGAVSVGIGSNDWAGGDNTVPYGYSVFLPGSTVTLDGKPIVDQGELKL